MVYVHKSLWVSSTDLWGLLPTVRFGSRRRRIGESNFGRSFCGLFFQQGAIFLRQKATFMKIGEGDQREIPWKFQHPLTFSIFFCNGKELRVWWRFYGSSAREHLGKKALRDNDVEVRFGSRVSLVVFRTLAWSWSIERIAFLLWVKVLWFRLRKLQN